MKGELEMVMGQAKKSVRRGRPVGARKINSSRLGPRVRGIMQTKEYRAQESEVKKLEKSLEESMEELWPRFVCAGCMTLFGEKEVEQRGAFEAEKVMQSRNWMHLKGLEKEYERWDLMLMGKRWARRSGAEMCSPYFCNLCKRQGGEAIKSGEMHESELIRDLRPWSERPDEVKRLCPALRSCLSMARVLVSGKRGVRSQGYFKVKEKIGEDFHYTSFGGDLRTDELLGGTVGCACGSIEWTPEVVELVTKAMEAHKKIAQILD